MSKQRRITAFKLESRNFGQLRNTEQKEDEDKEEGKEPGKEFCKENNKEKRGPVNKSAE